MIDSYAAIMFECLPEIVPERELPSYTGVKRPEGIDVAEFEHGPIACTRFRLKQCIVNPRCRLVAVNVFWDDIEVASNKRRHITFEPKLHLLNEAVHPRKFVLKLCCAHGISVRQIDVHNPRVLDDCFEKAGVANYHLYTRIASNTNLVSIAVWF